jgi:alkylation response protein AidB-like acyl-CoA dehydrogenase
MVDFSLTEEQEDMRELAHDFAEKEIRPVAWDYDRNATWPQQLIKTAWQVPRFLPRLHDHQYSQGPAGRAVNRARRRGTPGPADSLA